MRGSWRWGGLGTECQQWNEEQHSKSRGANIFLLVIGKHYPTTADDGHEKPFYLRETLNRLPEVKLVLLRRDLRRHASQRDG